MGNDISMVQQPHNIPSNKMTIVDDVHAGEEEVMSAIIFSQHGNVEESLQIVHNINRPVPSQGQILVKVHAYGINPFDVKLLEKSPKELIVPLPKIIGCDFSGTIVSIPDQSGKKDEKESTGGLRVGDKVLGSMLPTLSAWGSAAEYIAIDANLCAKVPTDNMDLIEGCGVPLPGLIVYQGFQPFVQHCATANSPPGIGVGMAALRTMEVNVHTAGKRVLIHGGSGDIGTLAIQYCKYVLGLYVITTVATSNFDFAKNLGADETISDSNKTFEGVIQPVDVVFDTTSCFLYEARTRNSSVLKAGGWYLKCPTTPQLEQLPGGSMQFFLPNMQLRPLALLSTMFSQQWGKVKDYLHRFTFRLPFASTTSGPQPPKHHHCIKLRPNTKDLQDFLEIMVASGVHVVIDRVFPMTLQKIKEAHNYVASGKACGKVVIRIQPAGIIAVTSTHQCQKAE